VLALSPLVFLMPSRFVMGRFVEFGTGTTPLLTRVGFALVAAPIAAILVAVGTFSPFLYYQF
jgi:alginate O-acetyltransferase complex protein AlgI